MSQSEDVELAEVSSAALANLCLDFSPCKQVDTYFVCILNNEMCFARKKNVLGTIRRESSGRFVRPGKE